MSGRHVRTNESGEPAWDEPTLAEHVHRTDDQLVTAIGPVSNCPVCRSNPRWGFGYAGHHRGEADE